MPPSPERQLDRLKARHHQKAAELAGIGFVMKGSVVQRFLTCGNSGCRCHADSSQRHGPYWQWNWRRDGKLETRFISAQQLSRYQEWSENSKRVDEIVAELLDIARQTDAILAQQERTNAQAQKAKPKRAAARRVTRKR